ncbi:hypothetical protein PQC07_gp215 [Aeromonas phage D3]|uniref:Uncharacterized protein n=1 Tax=Aeromonas phage D3 TaxID=2593327 RepID=A0A7D6EYX3_9CAUD|nr:hypothetical protein PQC07_gp215 [Aeromonas phage D3]QLM02897.1 hypothetical protein D3_0060 [Aeromonas phage D3]
MTMNQLNKIYVAVNKSLNVEFDENYAMFLNMGGAKHPVKVDDKQVYLGESEVLNGVTIGKVIFHPACESIMSKETEIFKVIRKLTAARLYQVVQPVAQVIFAVAGKKSGKTLNGKLVEFLAPFKAASKEVKDDVLALIQDIGITLDGAGIDNRMITFNMVKGGKDADGNHIYYTTTPSYPYYNEVVKFMSQNAGKKPGDRVVFNKTKVDYAALLLVVAMFELVFPSVTDPSCHAASVTTADCARLISFFQSYALVASEVNAFIGKFRKEFDAIGIYGIDLSWLGDLETIGELKDLIPSMPYNNYNTSSPAKEAAADPYAALLNTNRQVIAPTVTNTTTQTQQSTTGQPPAPACKPGEALMSCELIPSNGLYEFKYSTATGMIRIVTTAEDGRIQTESYTSPQALAAKAQMQAMKEAALGMGLMMPGMMQPVPQFDAWGNPIRRPTGIFGQVPPGYFRDSMTGQLVPVQQGHQQQGGLGTQDAWGTGQQQVPYQDNFYGGYTNFQ